MSWLVRLYPQAWQDRYQDEFLALLEQRPPSWGDALDIARGALDARLHPGLITGRDTVMRNRAAILSIFCAYIAFVVAGLAFYGTVDDSLFVPAMKAHTALALAWDTLAAGSAVALLAVVIGGLPIALAVFRHARAAARQNLRLLAVPALALAVLIAYAGVMLAINPNDGESDTRTALIGIGGGLFIAAAAASAAAVCVAITRSEIGQQRIRFKGLDLTIDPDQFVVTPAVIVILAMGLMLAAAIGWVIVARSVAPQGFDGNGGYLGTPPALGLLSSIVVMAISTVVAARAAAHGLTPHQGLASA